ncbi:MAG: hypothetical protein ACLGHL_03750 [Actinomycetota bacterium]
MQPLLAQEMLKTHLADLLSEAERARRAAETENRNRRWRRVLGYGLINLGSRIAGSATGPLPRGPVAASR